MIDAMTSDSLGLRIRRARERKRWTQAQLAQAVGVTARAVGDWERNVKTPLNSIGALEQVLAVDLTGGYEDIYRDVYTDPDEAALWALTTYSEDERRAFIDALRSQRRARAG